MLLCGHTQLSVMKVVAKWLLAKQMSIIPEFYPSLWAYAYFPGARFGHDTSKIVESSNSVFLEDREIPLLKMLDSTYGYSIQKPPSSRCACNITLRKQWVRPAEARVRNSACSTCAKAGHNACACRRPHNCYCCIARYQGIINISLANGWHCRYLIIVSIVMYSYQDYITPSHSLSPERD